MLKITELSGDLRQDMALEIAQLDGKAQELFHKLQNAVGHAIKPENAQGTVVWEEVNKVREEYHDAVTAANEWRESVIYYEGETISKYDLLVKLSKQEDALPNVSRPATGSV